MKGKRPRGAAALTHAAERQTTPTHGGAMKIRPRIEILAALLVFAPTLLMAQPSLPHRTWNWYSGEVVIQSLDAFRVVVALDETRDGLSDRLFLVETERPVDAMSLRYPKARIAS